MASYTITAFAPTDAANLTTPGPAGAFPTIGDEYRLDADWSKSTHALTIEIEDDDTVLQGDPSETPSHDTSQQTAVVTDANGSTVASGYIYAEYAFTVEGPGGATLTVHSLYIGGTLIGYAADGPVQPGANYLVTGSYNPNGGLSPEYSSFDAQNYEQAPDNNINGTSRDDELSGGTGNDTIDGGAGDDTIDGGAGDDLIYTGQGTDTVTAGTGSDTLVVVSGSDRTILTDFDLSQATEGAPTIDQLDVSSLTDGNGNPVNIWDVSVSDDGAGNALLTFPGGEELVLQGVTPAQMTGVMLANMGVPCFAAGTPILTPNGPHPVESLRQGDAVCTLGGPPKKLLWIGRRRLSAAILRAQAGLTPIRLDPRWTGLDDPVFLSPQHGVLVTTANGPRLARARRLTRLQGEMVRPEPTARGVTYLHLLLPRHSVLLIGTKTRQIGCESFYPGPRAVAGLSCASRRRLLRVFPKIGTAHTDRVYGAPAYAYAKGPDLPVWQSDLRPVSCLAGYPAPDPKSRVACEAWPAPSSQYAYSW